VDRRVPQASLDKIKGITRHYGHAGPAFVRALIETADHRDASALKDRFTIAARILAGAGAD
jgi:putative DNA primase/helicase